MTPQPKDYRDVMRKWIPYFELSRTAEGPATYFGGKRNIGGDQYLGLHPIGNCMVGLVLASSERRLIMHGGPVPRLVRKIASAIVSARVIFTHVMQTTWSGINYAC